MNINSIKMEDKINVRQFKLLNGEEIIALVTQKETGSYIIERPFLIRSNIVGGFLFLPWFPFSSQKVFKIARENILHHVEIDEDMKTEYIRLAADLNMRPKMNIRSPDHSVLDDLTDYINDTYDGFDMAPAGEEEVFQVFPDNVLPFIKPKDTIH